MPFVGVIEHTNLIPPEHYGGQHLVYLSNYLERTDRLYGLSHEELLAECVPHLRKVNPSFDPSWVLKSYHQKVNAAQPVIGTHYSKVMPDHRTPLKGVYLANTTQVYPQDRGTNYSVRMGKQVAQMVMADGRSATSPHYVKWSDMLVSRCFAALSRGECSGDLALPLASGGPPGTVEVG